MLNLRFDGLNENKPDWQFMEDYIKSLHYKPLTTKNKTGQAPDLNVSEWKEFRVGDLFKLQRGHTLTVEQKEEFIGTIPCVNGTIENNGIQCKLSKDIEFMGFNLIQSPAISIVRVGNGSKTFVQTDDFYVADNAFALISLQNISFYSMMFVSTLLDREQIKYSYGRTVTSDYVNTIIKLPVNSDGNPDWQFMENYIKALP
ncbi:MAG: restriction endonuclease subunit S, partial [Neisseriaceae bacterium]|nr:restriction endonuclease subunit S [Neisseriaceae bacterium]